jgi:hypothetical protein
MLVRTKRIETINSRAAIDTNRHSPVDKMEAIASGVQARLEESTSFSRKVTDETIKTARTLGMADSVIERWATQRFNRLSQEAERLREIRSILNRVYRDRPDVPAG